MEFSKQEYWSGMPFPSPGDLPDPGIKLRCPTLLADSDPREAPLVGAEAVFSVFGWGLMYSTRTLRPLPPSLGPLPPSLVPLPPLALFLAH